MTLGELELELVKRGVVMSSLNRIDNKWRVVVASQDCSVWALILISMPPSTRQSPSTMGTVRLRSVWGKRETVQHERT